VAGAAALSVFYGTVVEPRWLRRTRTLLHFRDLPPALEGLRIALLSDTHTRSSTPRRMVERAVHAANAARPDLIAITGDLAESEDALERTLDAMAKLHAPLGVFVVPGNHDYSDVGIQRWHDAVGRRPGLTNLTNRSRIVRVTHEGRSHEAARLCIAGVDDLSFGTPRMDLLPPQDSRDFTILLAHQPDQAEQVRRRADDVDLVVSGHTHGGQVRLPLVGAIVNSAEHPELYEAGVRRRPWTQVYTSRGIGTTHLPIRFLTPPEVAILTLTGTPRPVRLWRSRR
jgi:uncharacterized protein